MKLLRQISTQKFSKKSGTVKKKWTAANFGPKIRIVLLKNGTVGEYHIVGRLLLESLK